jgi:DNA polymerase-1
VEKKYLGQRAASKTVGVGLIYGQGVYALAEALGVSKDEGKRLIRKFFSSLPSIPDYYDTAISDAKDNGYCTTIMGRRRIVGGFSSYFQSDVAAAERKVKNTPIQGSAADIVKWAMIKLYEDPYIEASGAKMQVQVHDEVVMEIPNEVAADPYFSEHVQGIMAHPLPFDLDVPLTVGGKYGTNWKLCK